MLRRFTIAAISAALILTLAPVANAVRPGPRQHHATHTEIVRGPGGGILGWVSAAVNTHNTLAGAVEGKSWVADLEFDNVRVQWDYVHLYENGSVEATTDGTGWMDADGASHSTAWETCYSGRNYRTVVRVRMRRNQADWGAWSKFDSNVWTGTSFCN